MHPTCPTCGHAVPDAEPGARCPHHPRRALIPEATLREHPNDPMLGRVLGGRYPVVGVLGQGGTARVYRAIQEPIGREVAIKVIRPHMLRQEATLPGRFRREARTIARLRHPAVVELHDFGEDRGLLYMVLEHVPGRSLGEVLAEEGTLEPRRLVDLACGVLEALDEAHSMGIVHRDLKPDNLMVVAEPWGREQVKVLDFGLAKILDADWDDDCPATRKLVLPGTPRYMAPEIITERHATPRSDLYALGVTLFRSLTGEAPFDGPNIIQMLAAHVHLPIPVMDPALGVPAALEAVIRKAMAKDPTERYADAREMAAALRAAVAEAPKPARTARRAPPVRMLVVEEPTLQSPHEATQIVSIRPHHRWTRILAAASLFVRMVR